VIRYRALCTRLAAMTSEVTAASAVVATILHVGKQIKG